MKTATEEIGRIKYLQRQARYAPKLPRVQGKTRDRSLYRIGEGISPRHEDRAISIDSLTEKMLNPGRSAFFDKLNQLRGLGSKTLGDEE